MAIQQCRAERGLLTAEAEQIRRDPDLPIAVVPRADPDHGNRERAAEVSGQRCRHVLLSLIHI